MSRSTQFSKHSATRAKQDRPFLDERNMARNACRKATIRLPKHTEPKLVVMVLLNAAGVGLWSMTVVKYQVAATPQVVV